MKGFCLTSAISCSGIDNEDFLTAYRLLDPPAIYQDWELVDDEQLFKADLSRDLMEPLFPQESDRNLVERPVFQSFFVWLEFELAKFLSTIGQKSIGTSLWNHASSRHGKHTLSCRR